MVRGELSSLVNLMIPMEWARPEIWVFWGKSTAFMRLGSGAHVTALENSLFVRGVWHVVPISASGLQGVQPLVDRIM